MPSKGSNRGGVDQLQPAVCVGIISTELGDPPDLNEQFAEIKLRCASVAPIFAASSNGARATEPLAADRTQPYLLGRVVFTLNPLYITKAGHILLSSDRTTTRSPSWIRREYGHVRVVAVVDPGRIVVLPCLPPKIVRQSLFITSRTRPPGGPRDPRSKALQSVRRTRGKREVLALTPGSERNPKPSTNPRAEPAHNYVMTDSRRQDRSPPVPFHHPTLHPRPRSRVRTPPIWPCLEPLSWPPSSTCDGASAGT